MSSPRAPAPAVARSVRLAVVALAAVFFVAFVAAALASNVIREIDPLLVLLVAAAFVPFLFYLRAVDTVALSVAAGLALLAGTMWLYLGYLLAEDRDGLEALALFIAPVWNALVVVAAWSYERGAGGGNRTT